MGDETRRRFKVKGEAPPEEKKKPGMEPRSLDKVMRLGNAEVESGGATYPESDVLGFAAGRRTLGDIEGITKPEQYKIAEIGHGYMQVQKLDEANKIFLGLLALDPFDPYFNAAVGSVAQQQGRNEDAERFYGRSIQLNPFFATAYANRGELRIGQGDLLNGLQDLQKALELDPESKEPATVRARITVQVLREQLGQNQDLAEAASTAGDQTKARAKAAVAEAHGNKPTPKSGSSR